MGDETSLTIETDAKETLDEIRPDGQTWTEFAEMLGTMLSPLAGEETECLNCERPIYLNSDLLAMGGTLYWERVGTQDGDTYHVTNLYCSNECAAEWVENINEQFPDDPDEVLVGGRARPQVTLTDATFIMDGERREIGTKIPGAFTVDGEDYVGEPVYVKNNGRWVQSGVVDLIEHDHHEHTALGMGRKAPVERVNHPDPDEREEYRSMLEDQDCEEHTCDTCEESYLLPPMRIEACPYCGAEYDDGPLYSEPEAE